MDKDHDGKVTYGEFIDYLKANPEKVPVFKALAIAVNKNESLAKIRLSGLFEKSLDLSGFIMNDNRQQN